MKIIYVAVFTETSTNTPQANAFERLGHDIIRYDFKEKLKEFSDSANMRDDNLINICVSENPDLLLFSKGVGIDINVVATCKDICPVALWYMDPMINVDEELKQKITLDVVLKEKIKRKIKNSLSPRHVPSKIIQVYDIPKTKSVVFPCLISMICVCFLIFYIYRNFVFVDILVRE